ncbi:deoxycytidine triphosphate deaminase [uncultured Kordia sp.]|uniref:dCTP deaminase n=1 Tax=uncultured Kordia sp. TaxID=507699 RepID=UPI002605FE71|nr:deoxycytidine triphosphate deaminase [uncultured Kordia sp.]
MSFLANKELEKLLKKCISDNEFTENRLQNASYELTLGDEVYTNSDSSKTILCAKKPQFEVKPGQFAILMTKEEIEIPSKYIGFISLKFGFKFRGLVNVSGFHVDPGFKGKLKFSVYNAGSNSIILDRGQPYFVLWISELTSQLADDENYNGSHQGQNSISSHDIMKIKGEIASPNNLLSQIKEIKSSLKIYWWLLGIILVTCIGVCSRFYWQKSQYEKGYIDGYNKVEIENEVNKKVEMILNKKIDSLVGAKYKEIKQKKDSIE